MSRTGQFVPISRRLAIACLMLAGAATAVTAQAAPPVAASETDLTGIDVSHWQGEIAWADVVGAGVDFVIAKATEGRPYSDGQYATYKAGAEAVGLPFGAYHFAHPDATANDAVIEADNFVDTAALTADNLLPVLDLEDDGGFGQRRLRRWVKAWLAEVELRLGVKPIIYTSPSFWRDRMGNSRWFAEHGYRLWIAHWHVPAPSVPARKWAGRGWALWQYDDCGSVAGINGCVDLDRLNGIDIDALRIGPTP